MHMHMHMHTRTRTRTCTRLVKGSYLSHSRLGTRMHLLSRWNRPAMPNGHRTPYRISNDEPPSPVHTSDSDETFENKTRYAARSSAAAPSSINATEHGDAASSVKATEHCPDVPQHLHTTSEQYLTAWDCPERRFVVRGGSELRTTRAFVCTKPGEADVHGIDVVNVHAPSGKKATLKDCQREALLRNLLQSNSQCDAARRPPGQCRTVIGGDMNTEQTPWTTDAATVQVKQGGDEAAPSDAKVPKKY